MTYSFFIQQLYEIEKLAALDHHQARQKFIRLQNYFLASLGPIIDQLNQIPPQYTVDDIRRWLFSFIQDEEEVFSLHVRHDGSASQREIALIEKIMSGLEFEQSSEMVSFLSVLALIGDLESMVSRRKFDQLPHITNQYSQLCGINQRTT